MKHKIKSNPSSSLIVSNQYPRQRPNTFWFSSVCSASASTLVLFHSSYIFISNWFSPTHWTPFHMYLDMDFCLTIRIKFIQDEFNFWVHSTKGFTVNLFPKYPEKTSQFFYSKHAFSDWNSAKCKCKNKHHRTNKHSTV